jgi:putative endonuclease
MYFLYVLYSTAAGRYYLGTTNDVSRRLAQHNAGGNLSTKGFRPWILVYTQSFDTLTDARRREREIKSWTSPSYMARALRLRELGERPDASGR